MLNKSGYILITGSAGFIGYSLVLKLLSMGKKVIGLDNLNSYYDYKLKLKRISIIEELEKQNKNNWKFYQYNLEDKINLNNIFDKYKPNIVINLAAQAGVRYSLINPSPYINSNIVGFSNLLELCKNHNVKNLIYASSSSVYGGNTNLPFKENHEVNHPLSLYAATKKTNELLAHTYSHLYGIPAIGLRFFTVYGPWGRPDMAPMIFSKAIIEGKPISIFNHGKMKRDFTYIDDVVECLIRCCSKPATADIYFNTDKPNPSTSFAPHRIFNVGNQKPVELLYFIKLLEREFNKSAIKEYEDLQLGDVKETFSDNQSLNNWIDYKPIFSIERGIKLFADWYKIYHQS